MIFREMSRKLKSPRAAAEEDKKRKDLHEDSDEALVDGEEEVHVAPSRTAKKVSIGDVPAAPAEPDAPRDTPTDKQVSDFSRLTVARCTAHCLTRTFATTNQILLAQELAAKCLRLTNLKVEIPTTKTAIHPWITGMLNKGYGKFPPPSKKAAE